MVVLFVLCLGLKTFVLLAPYVCFIFLYSSKEVLHHLDFVIFLSDSLTNKF